MVEGAVTAPVQLQPRPGRSFGRLDGVGEFTRLREASRDQPSSGSSLTRFSLREEASGAITRICLSVPLSGGTLET